MRPTWVLVAAMASLIPFQAHARDNAEPTTGPPKPVTSQSEKCQPSQMVAGNVLTPPTSEPGGSSAGSGINAFTYNCLNMTEYKDFNILDLAPSLAATSDSGQIEVALGYTWRRTSPKPGVYRTSYRKLRGGIRVAVGSDTKAADLLDLTKFQFTKGLGGVVGFEWGRSAGTPQRVVENNFKKALDDAGADCTKQLKADNMDVGTKCSGVELAQWMRDKSRRSKYYGTIVKPLWGYDAVPQVYAGVEASYARPELSFFPLIDPAMTGYPTLSALPAGFPEGKSKLRVSKYYVTLYGGIAHASDKRIGWGATASVSYRRDAVFPEDTEKQSICAPGAGSYTRCYNVNIAPPYQTEGFAVSSGLRAQFPRYSILAPALEIKLSYAADIDQFAVDAPLYLFAGSDGEISGGIRGGCTTDGKTRNNYPIKGDCKAAFFIGGKFKLAGR